METILIFSQHFLPVSQEYLQRACLNDAPRLLMAYCGLNFVYETAKL